MPEEAFPGKTGPEVPHPAHPEAATKPVAEAAASPAARPAPQANNPLHGLTLEAILASLVERYGWEGLAERIPVKCFMSDPSIKSSLTFLRRTPWAREKVEKLYVGRLRRNKPAPRRF
ncbi:MAG: VF530 family DNA-binding protein [Rectinemataceae bacterium]